MRDICFRRISFICLTNWKIEALFLHIIVMKYVNFTVKLCTHPIPAVILFRYNGIVVHHALHIAWPC